MNKKICILALILTFLALPSFSETGFEFGLGSGYVFYGDGDTKDRNSLLSDANQCVLTLDGAFLIQMNDYLIFSLGGDSVFDFRWSGGNHINLIDYAFLAGVRVFPNFGGLFVSVDYALGRRTDFIELEAYDKTENTKWGNGFKIALGYDFSYHLSSFAPELVLSLKSMPRGGSRDNILGISLKLTRHK